MSSRIIKIDASQAVSAKRLDSINGTRVTLIRVDVPFTIAFDDDADSIALTTGDKGWKYKACGGNPIGEAVITIAAADAKAGAYIYLHVSADREIDAPKADSASAPREYHNQIATGQSAPIDQLSGTGTGGNKLLALNVAVAQVLTTGGITPPAFQGSGLKIGALAAQVGKLTHYYGVQIPNLFNGVNPTARDYSLYGGRKLVVEGDFYLEKSAQVTGRYWGFFGIGADGANGLNPYGIGFWYHYGVAGNLGWANENLYWAAQVYNSAGNWKDLKTANNATNGGIFQQDLGIPALGVLRTARIELEYMLGLGWEMRGYLDGVLKGKQTGNWPFMDSTTLAAIGPWFPEIRVIRETNGEAVRAWTNITKSNFSVWSEKTS